MTDPRQALAARIRALVDEYFALGEPPGARSGARVPLHAPGYGAEEVNEAIASLLSTRVTMGEKVRRFEAMWAEYLGVGHAVMVNSGSSANLLAVSALSNPSLARRLEPGDEVIVPAVAWSTTYFPLVSAGVVPVLVDVEPESFTIDPDEVERALGPRTRAVMPVHLLGNPCDMGRLAALARDRGLLMIEDTCEAHGARFGGRPVGTFGEVGTFSFYFSHHISTIEGGMLVTSDDDLADLARVLRAHGWQRDVRKKRSVRNPGIDERYLFVNLGYNLRPTDLQGAFGIHQLPRLEAFIRGRQENAAYWTTAFAPHARWLKLPAREARPGARSVWFGYPITVRGDAPFSRDELVAALEARGIETRPIMSGNFREQPALELFAHRIAGALPNAEAVMRQSFLIGNHHGIGPAECAYVHEVVDDFMERWA
jgi:CDP-6-deoxy-D-xylo-4-hexulose-3-dehydrase